MIYQHVYIIVMPDETLAAETMTDDTKEKNTPVHSYIAAYAETHLHICTQPKPYLALHRAIL